MATKMAKPFEWTSPSDEIVHCESDGEEVSLHCGGIRFTLTVGEMDSLMAAWRMQRKPARHPEAAKLAARLRQDMAMRQGAYLYADQDLIGALLALAERR